MMKFKIWLSNELLVVACYFISAAQAITPEVVEAFIEEIAYRYKEAHTFDIQNRDVR